MKAIFQNQKYDIPEGYKLKQDVKYSEQFERYLWCPQKNDLFYNPLSETIFKYLDWNEFSPYGLCGIDGYGCFKILGKKQKFWENNINIRKCIPIERINNE
jgi:hypothetical protein